MKRLQWKLATPSTMASQCGRYRIDCRTQSDGSRLFTATGPDGQIGQWPQSNLARVACETDSQHRPGTPQHPA